MLYVKTHGFCSQLKLWRCKAEARQSNSVGYSKDELSNIDWSGQCCATFTTDDLLCTGRHDDWGWCWSAESPGTLKDMKGCRTWPAYSCCYWCRCHEANQRMHEPTVVTPLYQLGDCLSNCEYSRRRNTFWAQLVCRMLSYFLIHLCTCNLYSCLISLYQKAPPPHVQHPLTWEAILWRLFAYCLFVQLLIDMLGGVGPENLCLDRRFVLFISQVILVRLHESYHAFSAT